MPKGGVAAARVHNEAWQASQASVAEVDPVLVSVGASSTGGGRTGRARQRAAWLHDTGVLARIGAASGVLSLFLQAFQG